MRGLTRGANNILHEPELAENFARMSRSVLAGISVIVRESTSLSEDVGSTLTH